LTTPEKMKTSTPLPPSARPRFSVRRRNGRLHLVIHLTMEVEEVQALQDQLSRGVVAAFVHDISQIIKPQAS